MTISTFGPDYFEQLAPAVRYGDPIDPPTFYQGLGAVQDDITNTLQFIDALNMSIQEATQAGNQPAVDGLKQQLQAAVARLKALQANANAADQPSGFFTGLDTVGDTLTGGLTALPTVLKWGAIGLVAVLGLQALRLVPRRRGG